MAFSDGDPFVSGSLYSFQQGNRMIQNYRGATVPSNLQAGALWSDSDDDRLWHQGTTLDEVFTEQTLLTWENLLSNSGFGVWSRSDTSKGLATITYDTGDKGAGAAPSVGDAVVGANGGTAKLISYTITSGAFADGDAAGALTVGAVSHDFAFVDNEVLTFGGVETAAVNMADSAAQVGLVQNGGFATDTDPPPGWTAVRSVLTTEGAGKVGNCMMITHDGGAENCYARSANMTVVAGKIYKFSVYVKQGTESTFDLQLYDVSNAAEIRSTGDTESGAGWVLYTQTFESPSGCVSVNIRLWQKCAAAAGTTIYFDEVTLYEITPCCLAADNLAFDGWYKDSTIDIYREHDGSNTKDGSFYALKCVPTAANDFIFFPTGFYNLEEWLKKFDGRTITLGMWIKTSTANHARLNINDGSNNYSSYHTGGGAWEWIEVTATMSATSTDAAFQIYFSVAGNVDGTTIVYISQPMLVFGSHIGEGNYAPKSQEVIFLEAYIASNFINGLTSQATQGPTDINLEADSDAKLPKGAKAFIFTSKVRDSGSGAAVEARLYTRPNAAGGAQFYAHASGLFNDAYGYGAGNCGCDPAGDYQFGISATGADTLDVGFFRYVSIQVN